MDPLLTSLPLAQGKKATGLAIASPVRNPLASDIPTFAKRVSRFRVLYLVRIVGPGETGRYHR